MNDDTKLLTKSKQLIAEGKHEEIIDLLKMKVKSAELLDPIRIPCLSILSKAYGELGHFDDALHNYAKCYQYWEKENNSIEVSKVLHNMSVLWLKKGEQEQADIYKQKALEMNADVETKNNELLL